MFNNNNDSTNEIMIIHEINIIDNLKICLEWFEINDFSCPEIIFTFCEILRNVTHLKQQSCFDNPQSTYIELLYRCYNKILQDCEVNTSLYIHQLMLSILHTSKTHYEYVTSIYRNISADYKKICINTMIFNDVNSLYKAHDNLDRSIHSLFLIDNRYKSVHDYQQIFDSTIKSAILKLRIILLGYVEANKSNHKMVLQAIMQNHSHPIFSSEIGWATFQKELFYDAQREFSQLVYEYSKRYFSNSNQDYDHVLMTLCEAIKAIKNIPKEARQTRDHVNLNKYIDLAFSILNEYYAFVVNSGSADFNNVIFIRSLTLKLQSEREFSESPSKAINQNVNRFSLKKSKNSFYFFSEIKSPKLVNGCQESKYCTGFNAFSA